MAATWDTILCTAWATPPPRGKYNQAMREDHHEMFFGLTFWTPNTNIFRFALGSRPGDQRRRSFFHGSHGRCICHPPTEQRTNYLKLVSTPKHLADNQHKGVLRVLILLLRCKYHQMNSVQMLHRDASRDPGSFLPRPSASEVTAQVAPADKPHPYTYGLSHVLIGLAVEDS